MLPDGPVVTRLKALLPNVIDPQYYSDAELTALGIARCVTIRDPIQWWQTYSPVVIDLSVRPVTRTYPAVDRSLEEVQGLAWERIKQIRAEKRAEGIQHTFPGSIEGSIQIRDEDITNLLSIHAAATTALIMQQSGSLPFTDSGNITHMLTPEQAVGVTMAAFSHGALVHVTSQTLRAQIDNAETVEAVIAVQWPGV